MCPIRQQPTSGFTQAGVYARRQFCADLEVHRPPESLWNPRLREAATTLYASAEDVVEELKWNGESEPTTSRKLKIYISKIDGG